MQKLKNVIRFIKADNLFKIIRNFLILLVSFFIPKSDSYIIIGGWFGQRFADNSKYLFLNIFNNLSESGFKKVIWISRNKSIVKELSEAGFEAYSAWDIRSIWSHFRSKYHVIDQSYKDINSIFSVRSKRIHLWHGFPLKRVGEIGKYIEDGEYKNNIITKKESYIIQLLNKLKSNGFWNDYYLLGTSELSADIMGKAFNVVKEKVFISGYPRNFKPIFESSPEFVSNTEKEILKNLNNFKEEGYKLIGYFPTFRDTTKTIIFGTEEKELISSFLNKCEKNKIKIISKFHSAEKNTHLQNLQNHPSFLNLPADTDIYSYLDLIDIVITDYSSIGFDFLMWDRPVILFPYDLDYYKNHDRKLIFDYEKFTPGPKVYTIEDLEDIILEPFDQIVSNYNQKHKKHSDEVSKLIYGDYKNYNIFHLIKQIKD